MTTEKPSSTLMIKCIAPALGLGLLVSPDTLVRLGDFTGRTGWPGWILLAGAMVVFFFLAAAGTGQPTQDKPGIWQYVPLTVKLGAAIFLSTGILVSAGFVFNEIFLYWFPNFGFAFLLLGLVLGIQVMKIQTGLNIQILAVLLTLACILPLVIGGMVVQGPVSPALPEQLPGLPVLFFPLMLWIGFDLAGFAPAHADSPNSAAGNRSTALGLTIAVSGILFLAWAVVSTLHVPLDKLSGSTIPHLRVARSIMGDTGRYLMGGAVIFGTFSAVNALFLACRISGTTLARNGALPKILGKPVVIPLVLALCIGLMMALGMAGSERLENWIQAVFILWLMTYAAIPARRFKRKKSPTLATLAILIAAGSVFLLFSGESPLLTISYLIIILGVSLAPGLIFTLASKQGAPKKHNQPHN